MSRRRLFRCVVVGRGLIGSAAARHLSEASDGIALVGPDEPRTRDPRAGPFASHHDAGRITRILDADPVWGRLAAASIERYRALEAESGIPFYSEHAYLTVAVPRAARYLERVARVGRELDATFQALDAAALRERFGCLQLPSDAAGLLQTGQAGHIDPRGLRAAQEAVAAKRGVVVVREPITRLARQGDAVELETAGGRSLAAERVLVATGGYTEASRLWPRRLRLVVQGRSVVRARAQGEALEALRELPSLVVLLERGADVMDAYLMQPIAYPDGRHYVKIGTGSIDHRLDGLDAIQAWFSGAGGEEDRRLLHALLQELIPLLRDAPIAIDTCLYTETASGYPYVDALDDGRLVLATGGNGKAAKSSDEIGRLAAELLLGRPWSPPWQRSTFRAHCAEDGP